MDMRERKYVKLKVNMFEDTKFKMIDMKPERDLIHYVWTRIVTLAGKVNLEGNLYMSKTIPYTIETLAIEFNREISQIKLALDVFMELEMIELTEDNVYRVKNFAKHQNIKVKETVKAKKKEDNINIKEVKIKETSKNEMVNNEREKTKKCENKIVEVKVDKGHNLERDTMNINKTDNTICDGKNNNNLKDNKPIVLAEKKNKKADKSKGKNDQNTKNIDVIEMEEENEESSLIEFYDGDEPRPLGEDESVVAAWSF
jgi:predicted phage replisome organizer